MKGEGRACAAWTLGIVLLGSAAADAGPAEARFAAPWVHGPAGRWHDLMAVAAAEDGSLAVVVASEAASRGGRATDRGLLMWWIGSDGTLKSEAALESPSRGWPASVVALAVRPDRTLWLVIESTPGRPSLTGVDRDGRTLMSVPLAPAGAPAIDVLRLVPVGQDCLALGSRGGGAWSARFDSRGQQLWQRVAERREASPAAVPTRDGGLFMMEVAGSAGETATWIVRLDGRGQVTREASVGGAGMALVAKGEGVALLYDAARGGRQQDLRLQVFTAQLEPAWAVPVLSGAADSAALGLAALPEGRLVVAGSRELRPWARWYEADGKERASAWDRELGPTIEQDVVTSTGGRAYLLFTQYEVSPTNVVTVRKPLKILDLRPLP